MEQTVVYKIGRQKSVTVSWYYKSDIEQQVISELDKTVIQQEKNENDILKKIEERDLNSVVITL